MTVATRKKKVLWEVATPTFQMLLLMEEISEPVVFFVVYPTIYRITITSQSAVPYFFQQNNITTRYHHRLYEEFHSIKYNHSEQMHNFFINNKQICAPWHKLWGPRYSSWLTNWRFILDVTLMTWKIYRIKHTLWGGPFLFVQVCMAKIINIKIHETIFASWNLNVPHFHFSFQSCFPVLALIQHKAFNAENFATSKTP